MSASPDRLGRVPGITANDVSRIGRVAALLRHANTCKLAARPVLSNWRALLDYLTADMAHRPIEQFRVLHLNTKNMLIRDELMWTGSIDEAPVHVRELMHRALDLGSASLILVHNHPSGDPTPSRADIDVTRSVIAAGRTLGIGVHDHLIIGAHGYVSLRSRGLM